MARNPDECGAMWIKEGRKGKYLSGTIEGIGAVVMFKNERKTNEKAPDYRILRSKSREEREAEQRTNTRATAEAYADPFGD